MAEIAQGYVHLRPFSLRQEADSFGDSLLEEVGNIAREIYGFPVKIDISVEEGSLKIWATAIVTLYSAIAVYPQFKDGLKALKDDAVNFGGQTVGYIEQRLKPKESQIFRTERRTKISGRLYRLARRIEKFERSYNDLNENNRHLEAELIQEEMNRIIKSLDKNEANFIKNNMVSPIRKKRSKSPEPTRVAIKEEQIPIDFERYETADDSFKKIIYHKSEIFFPNTITNTIHGGAQRLLPSIASPSKASK
jgi:hypothetical protein